MPLRALESPFHVVAVLMSSFGCSHPLPLQEPQRAAGSLQIRHTAARKGKGAAGQTAPEAQLEKKVVNCLACGKIYDCRSQEPTNDTLLFLGGYIVAAPASQSLHTVSSSCGCFTCLCSAEVVAVEHSQGMEHSD